MAKHQAESEYLYGLHDPGGESIMAEGGCKGWVLFSEALGSDPNESYRGNYTAYRDAGYGVMVRLNNGYYGPGTLPHSSQYENFARRCAAFVAGSPGAHIWIIGNEMNMLAERPGAQIDWSRGLARGAGSEEAPTPRELRQLLSVFAPGTRGGSQVINPGETITPEMYARCYTLCRNAIHNIPGHADDLVIVGAVAPWNDNTGDWIAYFQAILTLLGAQGCDGIAIHTYSHGANPDLIHDESKMGAPYERYHYNFRTYQDFMHAIPTTMRHLPVYITETDQDRDWEDRGDSTWIERAYGEIDWWNRQARQQIRALILYRWETHDRYHIRNKGGIINDFRRALQQGYRWQTDDSVEPLVENEPAPALFSVGAQIFAQDWLNVRKSPGHLGKLGDDIWGQLAPGAAATVTGAAVDKDGLTWWPVQGMFADSRPVAGWVAAAVNGIILLATTPPVTPRGPLVAATAAYAWDYINLRQDPGYLNKPSDHVLGQIPYGAPVMVLEGPVAADGLLWWLLRAPLLDNQVATGWAAELDASGRRLFDTDAPPPPTPPVPGYLGRPIQIGDMVTTVAAAVNLRQSAGYVGQPPEHVLATALGGTALQVIQGPQSVDGLDWWQVQGAVAGQTVTGWVAVTSPSGVRLIAATDIAAAIKVGRPFQTDSQLTQGWGLWPEFYSTIPYDGVPLKGHNGLDFDTEVGTPLFAVDAGVVRRVGFEADGFGNFIIIEHTWGESLYAHLETVSVGEQTAVAAGQMIGRSGETGKCFGRHLHFGLRVFPYRRTDGWGGFCDPSSFMDQTLLATPRGSRGGPEPMAPELPGRLRP